MAIVINKLKSNPDKIWLLFGNEYVGVDESYFLDVNRELNNNTTIKEISKEYTGSASGIYFGSYDFINKSMRLRKQWSELSVNRNIGTNNLTKLSKISMGQTYITLCKKSNGAKIGRNKSKSIFYQCPSSWTLNMNGSKSIRIYKDRFVFYNGSSIERNQSFDGMEHCYLMIQAPGGGGGTSKWNTIFLLIWDYSIGMASSSGSFSIVRINLKNFSSNSDYIEITGGKGGYGGVLTNVLDGETSTSGKDIYVKLKNGTQLMRLGGGGGGGNGAGVYSAGGDNAKAPTYNIDLGSYGTEIISSKGFGINDATPSLIAKNLLSDESLYNINKKSNGRKSGGKSGFYNSSSTNCPEGMGSILYKGGDSGNTYESSRDGHYGSSGGVLSYNGKKSGNGGDGYVCIGW